MPRSFSTALLLGLAACRSGASERPEGPLELLKKLCRDAPLAREEALERLARQRLTAREFIESTALSLPDSEEFGRQRAMEFLNQDTASLRSDLERCLGESTLERRIWTSHHVARRACLGRSWASLEPSLRRQGLGWKERYEPDDRVTFYRYVLPRVPREHLFFWVKVIPGGPGGPWVSEVFVGVLLAFGVPFARAAEERAFAPGTVLGLFFGTPALREIAALYPTLEEIEVAYGRIRDHEQESVPSGFHVNASFLSGAEGSSGHGVYGTIEAGLDPPQSSDGRWQAEGFRPNEKLGEFVERGRSLFGAPPNPSDRR